MASDDCGEAQDAAGRARERPTCDEDESTTIERLDDVQRSRSTFCDSTQRPIRPSRIAYDELKKKLKALSKQISESLLRISEIPPSKDGRHIDLDVQREISLMDDRTNKPYVDNTIRSSRYTLWNFLPRQLFAQFSKLANFYFLCVSIVQLMPSLSTTGRYTTLVPLLFFVAISVLKEGHDDLRRSRLDKDENNRTAFVLRAPRAVSYVEESSSETPKLWVESKWQDLKVGSILRIQRDQAVPADIVLLHVDGANGLAYIETMALDGETNLKTKQASPPLEMNCSHINQLCSTEAHFVVEDPNPDLYTFEGKVSVAGKVLPLTNNEIIYRGSILRNVPEVFGVVIYTGEECKIRMNATKNPRTKAPTLQAVVNKVVMITVCFVVALSIFNTIAYHIWRDKVESQAFYLSRAGLEFFQLLATFFLMFNGMIPLSLYISLEIVKLAQVSLMNDIDMYDEQSDTPMEPRTSTINEELGQVSYIFSDKTGTLTDNKMQFRKMSVAGSTWLHDPDLHEQALFEVQKKKLLDTQDDKGKHPILGESVVIGSDGKRAVSTLKNYPSAFRQDRYDPLDLEKWHNNHCGGRTEEMLHYIQSKPHTNFARSARFFLLSIALCHTCLPEKGINGRIQFQAASADELALVKAAQDLGYLVVDRRSHSITIRTYQDGPDSNPVYETYEILGVIEFSSARKRMSIIVRMPDQKICVFCKGADTVIQRLLRLSVLATEKSSEIEQRANKRKSIKAQQAIRRVNTARANTGLLRPSTTRGRLPYTRDDVDCWLKHRENETHASQTANSSLHCSPPPSVQLAAGRKSLPSSEGRASRPDAQIDELVEGVPELNDNAVFERCFQHINDFASEGLRVLLYAYKHVNEADYAVWRESYQEATISLVNRQSLIEQAGDRLERDLELIGVTAVEDKLQRGVPEAIDKLRRANIKIWMLTGDKRETAINIGYSCGLVKDYSTILILDRELDAIDRTITAAIVDINNGAIAHCAVIIDGHTLAALEAHPTVRDMFLDLIILANSVICCRASPSQKASLVKSVRKRLPQCVTLAIGDGANDIAMIQEAHVGIGITGKEGLQAARISDYSIAQFRFLLKLLLVHGHWNYIRTCKYVLGMFWKELMFYLTQALYQHWNGYTGISLYEPWSLTMFQPVFTCLPVVFMGIYEKDLAASTLLAVPELYTKGQRNGGFNIKIYLWWAFMSASDAIVIFFVMLGSYGNARSTKANDLYAMGTLTYTACVIIISVKMQVLEMHNKSRTVVIAILFSVGSWFVWNLVLSFTYTTNDIYNVKDGFLKRFGTDALWWLTLIVILSAVLLYELAVSTIRAVIWPTDVDIFQGYEKDLRIRERFEEAAAEEMQLGRDRSKKSDL